MAADGIKVRILQQHANDPAGVNSRDPNVNGTHVPGKIRLHDHAVGDVIVLDTGDANLLISKGWAVAV